MKFQDQIENDTTQDHDIINVGVKIALDMGRSDVEAALLTSSLYSQTEKNKGDKTDKLPSPIPMNWRVCFSLTQMNPLDMRSLTLHSPQVCWIQVNSNPPKV